jgi:hypothetical protein
MSDVFVSYSRRDSVEDRSEYRWGIKALWAVPVDRAVGSDERRAVEVADDAVLGDRQISG